MNLRYGSVDENVRKRSIQDVILHERQRFEKTGLKGKPKTAEDVVLEKGSFSDRKYVFTAKPVLLCPSHAGELAVISAVNSLAAQGIRAKEFSPVILLPFGTSEDLLRELMGQICRTAFADGIEIGEVQAHVTDAVRSPAVIGTAMGERFQIPCFNDPDAETGKNGLCQVAGPKETDIVLAGPVGLEGTFLLVCEELKILRERFPMSLLTRMLNAGPQLSVLEAAEAAMKIERAETGCREKLLKGVHEESGEKIREESADQTGARRGPVMVSLGEGGFFTGLWELSKKTECGMEVDLQAVPLLQETIEITDFFGINPYAMRSAGSLLIASRNGEKMVQNLQEQGFDAARIGKLTGTKDKIIRNGEDVRFLDRPQTDTLALWYKEKA